VDLMLFDLQWILAKKQKKRGEDEEILLPL
jgi:hypothetical protein